MNNKEASKLGGQAISEKCKRIREEKEKIYLENPKKCFHCNNFLNYKQYKSKKIFCSRKCCTNYYRFKNKRYLNSKKRKESFCFCGNKKKYNKMFCSQKCSAKYFWEIRVKKISREGIFPKCTIGSNKLIRKYLLTIFGHKCQICQNTEWMGKIIPLSVDHIDGHWQNRKINNFRLICSNCDRQLPTWGSKNMGNGKPWNRRTKNIKLKYKMKNYENT